jgi:hypothetical protein
MAYFLCENLPRCLHQNPQQNKWPHTAALNTTAATFGTRSSGSRAAAASAAWRDRVAAPGTMPAGRPMPPRTPTPARVLPVGVGGGGRDGNEWGAVAVRNGDGVDGWMERKRFGRG